MSILITGGAGYIGGHIAKQLLEKGSDIVILDNLSTGKIETIETLKRIRDFSFIQLDLSQFDRVRELFEQYDFDTVIHLAASIIVAESVEKPMNYYMNNTVNTTNLLTCVKASNVRKFIFSSTAAVYGETVGCPATGVEEDFRTLPISPYGESKLMSENVLRDLAKVKDDFKYVILRYFNVAGADTHYEESRLAPRIGQSFPISTHLIKIASECSIGKRNKMYIYGEDCKTPDGTCIRDYLHVDDLASAHLSAIEYLDENESNIFNCGYGKGYSVKEIIDAMKRVSGVDFTVSIGERRFYDPEILVAGNAKIMSQMNWTPKNNDIDLICRSSLEWERHLLKVQQIVDG